MSSLKKGSTQKELSRVPSEGDGARKTFTEWPSRSSRSSRGSKPQEIVLNTFSILGPTAMPILFAFIIGRCIKTFAHWRLQQGERIASLDLLYGSTTAISTISTMIDIGEYGIFTLILIIVWALSPLGAQSALRVLSIRDSSQHAFETATYFNMSSAFPRRFELGNLRAITSSVNAVFMTSLGATDSTKKSSLDTWGNIKVPILESLPGYG